MYYHGSRIRSKSFFFFFLGGGGGGWKPPILSHCYMYLCYQFLKIKGWKNVMDFAIKQSCG